MTDNNHEDFYRMIEDDPELQAKWSAITETIINLAAEHGAELNRDTVANFGPARLALWVDEPLSSEGFERQLFNLPQVKEAKRIAQTKAKLEAGNQEAIAHVAAMSKADRMEYARAQNLMGPSDETRAMTADEEADRLKLILALPPAARINAARKWGLA